MTNTFVLAGSPYSILEEEHNILVEKGFKFYVQGDWEELESIDPWSGMPNLSSNTHYFMEEDDAIAYAEKQLYPFNHNIHGKVCEAVRKETYAEREARWAEEKRIKAERKKANLIKKAQAMNMTVADYQEYVRLNRQRKAHQNEVKRLQAEIARLQAEVEEHKDWLANH